MRREVWFLGRGAEAPLFFVRFLARSSCWYGRLCCSFLSLKAGQVRGGQSAGRGGAASEVRHPASRYWVLTLCRLIDALSPVCRLRGGRFDGLPVVKSLFFCPGRGGELAAYAAGVSTSCRPPSHFSFVGPRTRRGACERRSRPEGRRAGCPESKKSNPKKMALRAGSIPVG